MLQCLDSRAFGPVSMTDIVGRAIYTLVNEVEHMPVNNRLAVYVTQIPLSVAMVVHGCES